MTTGKTIALTRQTFVGKVISLFLVQPVLGTKKSLCGKWMGKQWKQGQTLYSWAPEITADGDCSHEIKKQLLLGRKAMVFPVFMYGCES